VRSCAGNVAAPYPHGDGDRQGADSRRARNIDAARPQQL